MIPRTVYDQILHSISLRPVVLITGARQVGKTTLCLKLRDEKGFSYISLRDKVNRELARNDPELFLETHPWPLIIDEIQYAPALFESIESRVDREKEVSGSNKGMYVLTGSQAYKLMEGVTDSLAGRISIINVSPLTLNEIVRREERTFDADIRECIKRSSDYSIKPLELYKRMVRGSYPEPESEADLSTDEFYSNYVSSYIDRDVCDIINVRNKDKFHSFMQLIASLTGQELNYDKIASAIGVDNKTVKSWISVLIAGDIIHLLQPYHETSMKKRIVKRPKLYFWDTGLACHLARVLDAESLIAGYLKGPMTETFIVDEILKSYRNSNSAIPFYYYRDSDGNEIDLVGVVGGKIMFIECKAGSEFGWDDVKVMSKGIQSKFVSGNKCIVCLTQKAYPIKGDIYAVPVTSI